MKRMICFLLPFMLLLTSCGMENTIPQQSDTFSLFFRSEEQYRACVDYLSTYDHDCLISRSDFYAPEGSTDFTGLYLQNMSTLAFTEMDNPEIVSLFENTSVKLIDLVHKGDLTICTFDMCKPGRNFDYGIYFVSEDAPVYFGDTSVTLSPSGNGFSYEQSASYGTKFTFYTEKITEHYYYYEIM